MLLTKGREKDLKTEIQLAESVEDGRGQQLERSSIPWTERVLTEYPITSSVDIEPISFFSALGVLAEELLRL